MEQSHIMYWTYLQVNLFITWFYCSVYAVLLAFSNVLTQPSSIPLALLQVLTFTTIIRAQGLFGYKSLTP